MISTGSHTKSGIIFQKKPIDIWESEESWQRFVDERLHPVVHSLLAEVFGNDLPPEPERMTEPLIDVWVASRPPPTR